MNLRSSITIFSSLISIIISTIAANNYKEVYQLEGLPQNDAQVLFQDSKGFIWIGTLDGLHRYDGYSYKSYYVNDDGDGLCGNMVISMDEDTLGNIWIATYGRGVCRFDPNNESFVSFKYSSSINGKYMPDDVSTILVDHNNVIWVTSWEGLQRVTLDESMSTILDVRDVFKERTKTTSIFEDEYHQLWAGANGKIHMLLNPYTENEDFKYKKLWYNGASIVGIDHGVILGGTQIVTAIRNENKKNKYDFYSIIDLREYGIDYVSDIVSVNGDIWTASRSGVDVFSQAEDGHWIHQKNYKNDQTSNDINSNIVVSIIKDVNDHVWIGTRGGGVSRIQTNPKPFSHYGKTEQASSLSDNATRCIYIDSYQQLWVGTESGGVNVKSAYSKDFSSGFTSIAVNTRNKENRVYAIEEMPTPEGEHKSLLFMGTSFPNNLVTVDPVTYQVKNTGKEIGFVFALECYDDTTLWAGTYYNGLWRLTINKRGEIVNADNFLPRNTLPHNLTSNIIRHIKKDAKGNLWVATDKGLNLIEASEVHKSIPVFKNFTQDCKESCFPFDYNLQIFESHNGHLFLGTMGGGLIEVIEDVPNNTYSFKQLTKDDGLPNNTVKSIAEDDQANLWLSTNLGLVRYNYASGAMVVFDEYDGLQDNEFSEICSAVRDDGLMFFGGRNGFNAFLPRDIVEDTVPPSLFFTSFALKNKTVEIGEFVNGRMLLHSSIEDQGVLNLKYKERDFSIEFLGLQYNTPVKNKYRYMLDGYDDNWVEVSSQERLAKYTNLNHGEYTFFVTAANSDGYWANEPIALTLIIATPFWLSWWFIILMVLLIASILVVAYRHHFSRLEEQKRILANMVEEQTAQLHIANEGLEELNATKDKFFSIIAHDLRNPLNSFLGFTELLNADIQRFSIDRIHQMVGMMNHTAKSLYSLLENLLQWSRLQRGVVQFDNQDIDLQASLTGVMSLSNDVALAKAVTLVNEVPEHLVIHYDKNTLEMIVRNLLSNAIKFTPTGGTVTLTADVYDANYIRISIKDTGIGMSKDLKDNIFRVDKNTGRPGTNNEPSSGLGLILCKEFVEKCNGTIWVESVEMEGSTFNFTVTRSMP